MTLKSGSRDLALETMDSTREGGAGGAGSVERVDAAVTGGGRYRRRSLRTTSDQVWELKSPNENGGQ